MQKLAALRRRRRGLTLLELVMVVSILAILTALVVPGMTDQKESTSLLVAKANVQKVRDVIVNRYMSDMTDSLGYQGLPRVNTTNTGGGPVVADSTRVVTDTGAGTAAQLAYLPQLYFLFVNPRQYDATSGVVQRYAAIPDYDASTRLGWNGPYLEPTSTTYPNPTDRRFPKDTNDTRTWANFGFTAAYGQPGDLTLTDPWNSPIVISIQSTSHAGSVMYTAYVVSAGPNKVLELTADASTGAIAAGDDIYLPVKSWK